MILADTSVWVNHLRRGDRDLARMLEAESVGLHPYILGEFAAGNLRNRERVLAYFASLPKLRRIAQFRKAGVRLGIPCVPPR